MKTSFNTLGLAVLHGRRWARLVLLLAVLGATPMFSVAADAHAKPNANALILPESTTVDYKVDAKAFKMTFETDARLVWQRDGDRYRAEWTVKVPLLGDRTQSSVGRITSAGLAPERYTERARKSKSAVFDGAEKLVHFSNGRPDAALPPGTQDRLTASLQLGAMLAADPSVGRKGSVITVPTASVRRVESWRWESEGNETVQVGAQKISTIKLIRKPRDADDSKIELWLAPNIHHLPVRLRVEEPNGDLVDQRLTDVPVAH